jgi:chromosome segregation ATPase
LDAAAAAATAILAEERVTLPPAQPFLNQQITSPPARAPQPSSNQQRSTIDSIQKQLDTALAALENATRQFEELKKEVEKVKQENQRLRQQHENMRSMLSGP